MPPSSDASATRRDFLRQSAGAGLGLAALGSAPAAPAAATDPASCTLFPQQNRHRNRLDLSGVWEFQLDPEERGEREGWFRRLPRPRPIAVPASWNEQHEDARYYLGLAWHATEAWIPRAWQGERILLRVGSANYAARLWIGDDLVGTHEGGHLPFEFDVTERVRWDAPTRITIAVENKPSPLRVPPSGMGDPVTSGHPDVSFDFFPYAGLHRPVLLYTVPPAHVRDVTVVPSLAGGDAILDLRVEALWEGAGRARLETPAGPVEAALAFAGGTASARLRVPTPRLWSPADPFLHPLTVTLEDGGGARDGYTLPVGIRTVAVDGDALLLNGRPIRLRGFGRHEDFAVHGRGLDLAVQVKDAALMKWVGANSFRTSHYPYAEEAMDLADREGFLVIDELPAVGLPFNDGDDAIAARAALCRAQLAALVARDKNHPSVVMWSLANEPQPAGGGADKGLPFFADLAALARALDPTRPVTIVGQEGTDPAWLAVSDVVAVNRYWGWYFLGGRLAEARPRLEAGLDALHARLGKPILLSEFGADAIPGTHGGDGAMWSEEYQVELLRMVLEVAAARPFVVGTHVWNLADFKTADSVWRPAGMNFKGVFTRDRRPKMAAHFLRRQWAATP